jgi:biotin carboxyl carrier protein
MPASYTTTVNDEWQFEFADADLLPSNWDLATITPNARYHLLINGKSYNIEVAELNQAQKTAKLRINNHIYSVSLQTKLDALLAKMGIKNATQNKIDTIKAPMPGLVLKIEATPGQAVLKGDTLLVLEAMKMENVTVAQILVQQGQAVEKGAVLINMQ